jgi:hypothetical protein
MGMLRTIGSFSCRAIQIVLRGESSTSLTMRKSFSVLLLISTIAIVSIVDCTPTVNTDHKSSDVHDRSDHVLGK